MWKVSFVLIFLVPHFCNAQQSAEAVEFFGSRQACPSSLGGWKCLQLDLSSEVADQNDSTKQYEYSWNFGDGNRLQGISIEHCYAEFGSYQVTMDLLDMETNTVIRNELSAIVHLFPEISPVIDMHEGMAPGFRSFSYHQEADSDFQPDRVFWRIDGAHYEGKYVTHPFPIPGVYFVQMGVSKDMGFLGEVVACASLQITINDTDVWTSKIRTFLQEKRRASGTGPFVDDEMFCRIRSKTSQGEANESVIPLSFLMTTVSLEEATDYEIVLFSGSYFTREERFTTKGVRDKDMYLALRDSMISLAHRGFIEIPALRLATDEFHAGDSSALRDVAKALEELPDLKVEIGSYLHTKSRLAKGKSVALQRALLVRERLTSAGIAPESLSVASPDKNQALVNTCSALPDCDWEEARLNGRVEFRIIGSL